MLLKDVVKLFQPSDGDPIIRILLVMKSTVCLRYQACGHIYDYTCQSTKKYDKIMLVMYLFIYFSDYKIISANKRSKTNHQKKM